MTQLEKDADEILNMACKNMKGYAAFRIHRALMIHFTSASFDFLKYKGNTGNNRPSDFIKLGQQRIFYEKIEERITNAADLFGYIFVNVAHNPKIYCRELSETEVCDRRYRQWKARQASSHYWIVEELKAAVSVKPGNTFSMALGAYVGRSNLSQPPPVFCDWIAGKVSTEALIILDKIYGIFDEAEKHPWTAFHPSWKKSRLFFKQYAKLFTVTDESLDKYKLALLSK
jgi:hypothetical protein